MIPEPRENGLQVIEAAYGEETDLTEAAAGASIIRLANQLLTEAIEPRATDAHIEPLEEEPRVHYGVDGVLQQLAKLLASCTPC